MTTRLLAACCVLVAASAARASAHAKLAPADEYFGRMKMSPIEITNRISDGERGSSSYNVLTLTQNAIEDWTRKYPGDPWIPSREFRITELFMSVHSQSGYLAALRCRGFLHHHFPKLHFHFVSATPK
jgi:hypothetical protein